MLTSLLPLAVGCFQVASTDVGLVEPVSPGHSLVDVPGGYRGGQLGSALLTLRASPPHIVGDGGSVGRVEDIDLRGRTLRWRPGHAHLD